MILPNTYTWKIIFLFPKAIAMEKELLDRKD